MKNATVYFAIVALLILVVMIALGAKYHMGRMAIIQDECAPTNMYVIGNKSRATRVYDCEGVIIK